MAKAAIEPGRLWLPGFDPQDEGQAFPDLFDTAEKVPEQEAPLPQFSEPRSVWRPTLPRLVAEGTPRAQWPVWDESALDGLEGPVAKFEANLQAIEALQRHHSLARDQTGQFPIPSPADRRAMLRYTGWGGLPAAFNLGGNDSAWRDRAKRLQAVLSPEGYESAKASVTDAHYTDPVLVRWIWSIVRRLGFTGGRVLEPSAGVGHFLGCMPSDMAEASSLTAIEIDGVSAGMLKALYGPAGVDCRVQGFETATLAEESIDLVISNVPFGKFGVRDDRNRPYSRASIHAWFIGRSLDLVRPGGLVCVLTSSYVLDETDSANRACFAAVADLVAAFRLPQGSFGRLSETKVQADLLVLRKHCTGYAPASAEGEELRWLDLAPVPASMGEGGFSAPHWRINRWFVEHPSCVLGAIASRSNGYQQVPVAIPNGELQLKLSATLDQVPRGLIDREVLMAGTPTNVESRKDPAPEGRRPGSHLVHKGRICIVQTGELVDIHDHLNATARKRVVGMCEVRDRAREVLAAQLSPSGDGIGDRELGLATPRRRLNVVYDGFVAKLGCLTARANALAFRRDPDYPLLLSLEHYDDETDTATKADLFLRRTVARVEEPESAESPEEALAHSMQWRGRVDAEFIARLLGRPDAEVEAMADLTGKGLVFLDPKSKAFETADAYLSGDVKQKLEIAQSSGPAFAAHVTALEQVIPEDLPPASIEARLGAVWIPADVVEKFMTEVLKLIKVQVRYLALAGTWSIKVDSWRASTNVTCSQELGTARYNAVDLVECALNVQTPTVRDPDPEKDGGYIVNKEQTLAARERLGELKVRFAAWAYEDRERRERLCRIYNDTFNCLRPRRFDGSKLQLPGFSRCFELHPSQRDAIWRIVLSGNTGLFHAVGAGKTAIMVAASMERKRLGLCNKPAHIVPNHMLMQYTAEFVRLYPGASVLMATKEDLQGDRRREFVSRVATGAWDAVVMTHSTFEMLPMSPTFTTSFIKDIVRELAMAIRALRSECKTNRIVKQLERMKKIWQVRLDRLANQAKKDDFLAWEVLGIDSICWDEAHLAKNLWRHTKMSRIAGLPIANSQRAFDLFLKSRYTMSLYGGRQCGLVLATATPVANTMAEVHTFQRYLQPSTLRALGLEQFDAWAATFGETVTALEIAPDGSGYRLNTRFARFINVPDLMAVFCDVADIRTKEMLNLPVPALKGGKPRTVTSPPSSLLKAYVETLVKRAERLRIGRVDPRADNMLKITSEGRMAALDMRLVIRSAEADPNGKVAKCAAEVHRIWLQTIDRRCAQLVFCDLSTPASGRFSVYQALKDALIEKGLPPDEIAFIHDAETDSQKAKLFKQVREGVVRVLVGSTGKMGMGTNVQKRLVALHELDCPWRPCDVEQREGRILRQGNECQEVEVIRYVTASSFDSYSWQTVESKAKFIAQVMSGEKGLRSVEDVELATLNYAEVKALASGNPMVIEKAGVDADIARLSALFSVWRNQRYANESEVVNLPLRIASMERHALALDSDAEAARRVSMDPLKVTIHGRALEGKEAVGEALRKVVRDARTTLAARVSEEVLGRAGGLELRLFAGRDFDDVHLLLLGETSHDCHGYTTGPALYEELVSCLRGIEHRRDENVSKLDRARTRLAELKDELARPFEHEQRLGDLLVRQRALAKSLDLDKDETGAEAAADMPESEARDATAADERLAA
jgi:N12 class adenine-specific DNA methylase